MNDNNTYDKALKLCKEDNSALGVIFDLLTKAFEEENDFRAAYAIATWYLHGKFVKKDIKEGIKYLKIAAKNKIPLALYDLAISYEEGLGVKKNKRKAFKCYMKAVLEGEKQSIFEVGRCYYYGIGVKKDKKIADIWLEKAEELGLK